MLSNTQEASEDPGAAELSSQTLHPQGAHDTDHIERTAAPEEPTVSVDVEVAADTNTETAAAGSSDEPPRVRRSRPSGPQHTAQAQRATELAIAGDANDEQTTIAADLSTAPARPGMPFYPTAATHLRLSGFTTKGATDAWAGLVVGLLFLVIFIWGTVSLATFHSAGATNDDYYSYEELAILRNGSTVVSVCLLSSLLAMVVLTGGVLYSPEYVLMGVAGLGSVMLAVATVVALVKSELGPVLILLFLMFIQFFYAFLNRHTLMRCTEALRTVALVWQTYPAMVVSAYCVSVLAFVFTLLLSGLLMPFMISLSMNTATLAELFTIWVFMMICSWFYNVFPCVLSLIVSGVTATWYALEGDPLSSRSGRETRLYANLNPTFWMAVRAFWTNCGTACMVAAVSVQSSWFHWLAEGMSEVKCLANVECWKDFMQSMLTLSETAYRFFNLYSLVEVSVTGDKFVVAGPTAFAVVARCRDLSYFRHRLHVLTPLMVLYALTTATMLAVCFGVLGGCLALFAFTSVFMTLITFVSLVHHTWRALLYCYAMDRQPMAAAAPALQLEMDTVREEGERRFTARAETEQQPVIV